MLDTNPKDKKLDQHGQDVRSHTNNQQPTKQAVEGKHETLTEKAKDKVGAEFVEKDLTPEQREARMEMAKKEIKDAPDTTPSQQAAPER